MIPLVLKLNSANWNNVYTIPKGTVLQKGRHGLYHEMVDAAALVSVRFGCYGWAIESDTICYCGSFSKDYTKSEFKSNLHGRLHHYLQSHGSPKPERKNTNLMVFDNINTALRVAAVKFQHLEFESLEIGNDVSTYKDRRPPLNE